MMKIYDNMTSLQWIGEWRKLVSSLQFEPERFMTFLPKSQSDIPAVPAYHSALREELFRQYEAVVQDPSLPKPIDDMDPAYAVILRAKLSLLLHSVTGAQHVKTLSNPLEVEVRIDWDNLLRSIHVVDVTEAVSGCALCVHVFVWLTTD